MNYKSKRFCIVPNNDLKLWENYEDVMEFSKRIGRPNPTIIKDDNGTWRFRTNEVLDTVRGDSTFDMDEVWMGYHAKRFNLAELAAFCQDIGYSLCDYRKVFGGTMDKVFGVVRDHEEGTELWRGPNDKLIEKVNGYVDAWERETVNISSPAETMKNQNYDKLVKLGYKIIPILLERMKGELGFLFMILSRITREQVISYTMAGDIEAINQAWVSWGIERGYIDG